MYKLQSRVLFVDDDASARAYVAALLGERFSVFTAAHGNDALDVLRHERIEIVISDIVMPVLDGFGLCRAIRASPLIQAIPVILLSARTDEDTRVAAFAAGADDYVGKPVADRELIARLDMHLRRARERRAVARALADREEWLQLIIDSAKEYAIVTLDREGVITSWNGGAERLLDYTGQEIIGKHGAIFFTSEDVAAGQVDLEMKRAQRQGRSENERWHVRKDGSRFWGSGVMLPLAAGGAGGFLKIFRDRTAERDTVEQLKDSDRRKDEFLATLAHELRNPLSAITAAVHVLGRSAARPALAAVARDALNRQAIQMTRLLDDLLDASRITRGRLELRMTLVSLSTVIETAIETAQPVIDDLGQRLTVEQPAGSIHVEADPVRLAQIVSNLLTNAAKYSERGRAITLRVGVEHDDVVVRVLDEGIGIAPESLAGIFDMFVQLDTALERSRGGLGIGLALANGLARLHGGTLTAHSDGPGRGSEFVLRLPHAVSSTAARPIDGDHSKADGALEPRRVLVADDNRDAANHLAASLRLDGHEVFIAYDGFRAIELADEHRPDVAVLDIGMPRRNGYDVAAEIRERPWAADARLIAVSGWGRLEDKKRALAAGFNVHITKPVDIDVLRQALTPQSRAQGAVSPERPPQPPP